MTKNTKSLNQKNCKYLSTKFVAGVIIDFSPLHPLTSWLGLIQWAYYLKPRSMFLYCKKQSNSWSLKNIYMLKKLVRASVCETIHLIKLRAILSVYCQQPHIFTSCQILTLMPPVSVSYHQRNSLNLAA